MADLQSRLCNWRVEKAYLLRVKTKITQLLEEAKRIDRELDRRIRVSQMAYFNVFVDINGLAAGLFPPLPLPLSRINTRHVVFVVATNLSLSRALSVSPRQ